MSFKYFASKNWTQSFHDRIAVQMLFKQYLQKQEKKSSHNVPSELF